MQSFIDLYLHEITSVGQQLLIFLHLFAFAFAIVMIVSTDVKIITSRKLDVSEVHQLGRKITSLLVILWLTGIALLAIKPGLDLELIFANSKLAAKITVVSVLTINGLLLHLLVFPSFRSRQKAQRIVVVSCIFTAISTTSWIYAALVGAARVVAPIMNYEHYMIIYLAILAFALLISVVVVYPLMREIVKSISYPEAASQSSASSFKKA